VEEKKRMVEDKNKEITDSITYARRIQESIFQPESFIKRLLPDYFILFKPKDILSGDFYWVEQYPTQFYSQILDVSKPEFIIVGAVDCTGHGVPGALMSIVGNNLLNHAINEFNFVHPSHILNELNRGITQTLKQTFDDTIVKDGMDIALISYEIATKKLYYAGARNPIYYMHKNELHIYGADRHSIGYMDYMDEEIEFKEQVIDIKKGDVVYLFSDGYADQFGGEDEKKFKYDRFKKLLLSIHNKPMAEQKAILEKTHDDWKGNLEQVDDILVIGIRF